MHMYINTCVYMHRYITHINAYIHVYIYIYIYIDIERERDTDKYTTYNKHTTPSTWFNDIIMLQTGITDVIGTPTRTPEI